MSRYTGSFDKKGRAVITKNEQVCMYKVCTSD